MLAQPSPGTDGAAALARGYAPASGVHDEAFAPDGAQRPVWRPFLSHLDALGPSELARRWERARDVIHENGVSYNVYGDPRGLERPWSLSPIPVIIAGAEWTELSAGLIQRARVLDRLLADVYGPQNTLSEGLLPPELVYGHPAYLRACHSLGVSRGRWLPLYAADVVRAPDGRFVALADRTQAPSGAGYTLENRIVVSRALPEAFRACNVERLAIFFRTLQETLAALAPHNRDNPRVVLLTPGPHNATYFEQAYLAQYLGYTLVNGGDLTVRDDRVYLKTLGGLQPVDVILRRVNDDYCDPLELRPDSMLGVPGLVQAARQGNVAIANPLGSGIVQAPAFLPYLPALCRHFLSEDLLIPSVASLWCGDDRTRAQALEQVRAGTAVVKAAFPDGMPHPVFTAGLVAAERASLADRIAAEPRAFVVQEHVAASTTPALMGDALVPRALVVRGYAVSTRDGWSVMPGGLSRVAGGADFSEISMQAGAGSQDTWVSAQGPVSTFSLLPPSTRPVELVRGVGDLPSRAADNLYWLGRYAERAEGIARLVRVVASRLQIEGRDAEISSGSELIPLMNALAAQADLGPIGPPSAKGAPVVPLDLGRAVSRPEAHVLEAVLDQEHPGSLAAIVRSTLRVARVVRDRLSADTFRVLASLDDELRPAPGALASNPLGAIGQLLDRVVLTLAAMSGLAMESMTRGHAWRFLDMGRRLERAMMLVSVLRSTLVNRCERETALLEALLEIADSGITYRRRYLARLQVAPVLDLLLTDETNPRSVVYQLRALSDHVDALPAAAGGGVRGAERRHAVAALAALQLCDVEELAAEYRSAALEAPVRVSTELDTLPLPGVGFTPPARARGKRVALDELLERLLAELPALSDALSGQYMDHAVVSRHLGSDDPRVRSSGTGSQGEDA